MKASIKKSSQFRWNLLRRFVKTALKEFGRIYWWKLFLIKLTLLFSVLWQKIYWTFDEFFLAVSSKNNSKCPRELFEYGFFFWLFVGFHIFSKFELKCLDFAHNFETSLSTLLSNSLENTFDEIFLHERINIYFIFGLWPKFLLTFHNEFSAGLPKLHFALLDKDFMERKLFLKE